MKPADKSPGGGGPAPRNAGGGGCPVCGKSVQKDHRPFCSRRCANVDLNRWLSDGYVIKGADMGATEEGEEPS